jgi:hypothetical protein
MFSVVTSTASTINGLRTNVLNSIRVGLPAE